MAPFLKNPCMARKLEQRRDMDLDLALYIDTCGYSPTATHYKALTGGICDQIATSATIRIHVAVNAPLTVPVAVCVAPPSRFLNEMYVRHSTMKPGDKSLGEEHFRNAARHAYLTPVDLEEQLATRAFFSTCTEYTCPYSGAKLIC